MSNSGKYDSASNKAKGALARCEVLETRCAALEEALARSLVSIERRFAETNRRDGQVARIMEAIVEAVGPEQVQEIVTRRGEETAQKIQENDLAMLKAGLDDGYLSVVSVIGDMSLIVGNEVDGDGKPVGTGRQQVAFRGVDPQFQEQMIGKGVGTKLETPSKGTFEVVEIYDIDEEKARLVFQAKAVREAAEAAQIDEETDTAANAGDGE